MPLKTLDYGKSNPFGGTIGRSRTLAWPVDCYRVTLPRPTGIDQDQNPFELVILKILNVVGRLDAEGLAKETRIPIDLVKGIVLRLQDKGLIDQYGATTDRASRKIDTHSEASPEFKAALLFRELATGKILPFLHFVDELNPLKKWEAESKKEEEEEKYRRIIHSNTIHRNQRPGPQDVIITQKLMSKRLQDRGKKDRLPRIDQITIASSPETYYLRCPIAIQKNDGGFRIADPFGDGYSLILESAFLELLERNEELGGWFQKWQESVRRPKNTQSHEKNLTYETDSNWQRYPELLKQLRGWRGSDHRSSREVYASLEWALFYVCSHRSFEGVTATLEITQQAGHSQKIVKAAQNLGFKCSEVDFRGVKLGKVRSFKEGRAHMDAVMAIAVLQTENDAEHPLRRIATTHPDFFDRIAALKRRRDQKGHGEGLVDNRKEEDPDDQFMRTVVHKLIPDVKFETTSTDEDMAVNRDADSLLEARIGIQEEFGFKAFNKLGAEMQDRLIHSERFWLTSKSKEKEEDDAGPFAYELYAVLQATFVRYLLDKLPPELPDDELVGTADEIARNHGLGNLPECLSSVRTAAIRQTLLGRPQSLGACVVAFLLMTDAETLTYVASMRPTFSQEVANLIAIRGHGNESRSMSIDVICKLRRTTYSIVQLLQEI